jgi:signal transduction histidine kinase
MFCRDTGRRCEIRMRVVPQLKYILVFFLFSRLLSQNSGESPVKVIASSKPDSVKVRELNLLAFHLSSTNLDSAIFYGEKALAHVQGKTASSQNAQDNWKNLALPATYVNLSNFHTTRGDYAISLSYLEKAQKLYIMLANDTGVADCYEGFAYVNIRKGEFPKALENYFKSLRLNERAANSNGILSVLHGIAGVYVQLDDLEKALDFSERALNLAELKEKNIAEQLSAIGIIYAKKKEYNKALDFFQRALQLDLDEQDKHGASANYMHIGITYKITGELQKALEYLLKALQMAEETGNRILAASVQANIGDTYAQVKKFKLSEQYLLNALATAKELKDLNLQMRVEYILTLNYEDAGNHKKALEHCYKYMDLQEQVFNEDNTKKNVAAELNFEFEKKTAAQAAEHEKEVLTLEAENKLQKTTRNFTIALSISFLVIVIFGFIVYNFRKNLRTRKLHSQQLIASQEKERQRISKELHDSIGQNILFIKNQLIKNNDLQLLPAVNETLEEVRAISKDLYPNQLEKYGLVAAVDALAEKVKESSAIFVSHDLEALNKEMPPEHQINYYRIVQECVSNALKHAEASALRITATALNGILQLIIQDNGKGFSKTELSKKAQSSFGMLNIEERVKFLGGKFELETAPGKGTKYIFSFPII